MTLKNRYIPLLLIRSAYLDTIIYSESGDQVFVIYAQQFERNDLGSDLSPAYLSAHERDSMYWHLSEGPPKASYMGGSFHDLPSLNGEVRKFYLNQYSFKNSDSTKKNFIWRRP